VSGAIAMFGLLSPGDCLKAKAFMDPNFLGYMKTFVNSNMSNSNDLVSSSDISIHSCRAYDFIL
jgi:hypothetical protein